MSSNKPQVYSTKKQSDKRKTNFKRVSVLEFCLCFCCPKCLKGKLAKLAFVPPEKSYHFVQNSDNSGSALIMMNSSKFNKFSLDLNLFEMFFTKTERKNRIACMYVHITIDPRFTILFSHGNGTDLGEMSQHLMNLGLILDCNVFSYDYSGYGMSSGEPSEENLYADIDSAWNSLQTRYGVTLDKVILYGQSLGSVPTIDLAVKYEFKAVILHSPLMSLIRVKFASLAKTWCIDSFPNIDKVHKIKSTVLVIHGTDDQVIEFSHGIAIYERCPKTVDPLWVEGGGHNNIELFEVYFERLNRFIKEELVQ